MSLRPSVTSKVVKVPQLLSFNENAVSSRSVARGSCAHGARARSKESSEAAASKTALMRSRLSEISLLRPLSVPTPTKIKIKCLIFE